MPPISCFEEQQQLKAQLHTPWNMMLEQQHRTTIRHPNSVRRQQHHAGCSRVLLCVVTLLAICQQVHSSYSPVGPHHAQHWRKLLQLVSPAPDPPYNGSAVLSTNPQLNGTGATLRKLLPGVSGYVQKAGPAETLTWSQKPHYAVAREAIFLNWRQQELTNPAPQLYAGQQPTCAAARHPPVPFHHCHVFVNHEYKVAYIRSPKSASTSIMNWLGQCRYNKTRNWNSTTCLDYSWERYQTPQQIASIWKDYFFFGFIRNPWARAYSLYKDMTATNHFLHKHGPRCQLEWGKFCKKPFSEFDRLYSSGCSHKPPHYAYWHMMDQYHCMITPTGDWAVDFLGRVERGNEDWKVVVEEMNKRRLPGVPEVPFSALDHVHKVEPVQQPDQLPQQQEQQQQQPQQHLRPNRQLFVLEEQPGPALQPQLQVGGTPRRFQMLGMFRKLWRRIQVGAAAANEDDAEADGEVEDFASGSGSAPGSPSFKPDKDGASGPYTGPNEHCIDAVSQWFACDIENFGYLPQREGDATNTVVGTAATEPAAAAATVLTVAAAPPTVGVEAGSVGASGHQVQQQVLQRPDQAVHEQL